MKVLKLEHYDHCGFVNTFTHPTTTYYEIQYFIKVVVKVSVVIFFLRELSIRFLLSTLVLTSFLG